jgi:threonine aldolase
MSTLIDLRSDTVTRPTDEMRKAIADAEVGDDVYGEDPSINRLEAMLAEMLGNEAGLFMASGTMSNHVGINTHTHHGEEIICHRWSHCFNFEGGAGPAMSGVGFNLLDGDNGVITAEQVEAAIRPNSVHYSQTALIEIENTHNKAGGTVFPLAEIQHIRKVADAHGVPMHLDGARLFNAVVASGIEVEKWADPFESVSICLSKGLGAPVGSVLVGSHDFIDRARRVRKRFGGGMRQGGILAAAGIFALENNIDRLVEDHQNARRLAEAVNEIDGFSVDLSTVQTNIVMVNVTRTGLSEIEVTDRLNDAGVFVNPFGPGNIRVVTHLDVTSEQIEESIKTFERILDRAAVPK